MALVMFSWQANSMMLVQKSRETLYSLLHCISEAQTELLLAAVKLLKGLCSALGLIILLRACQM